MNLADIEVPYEIGRMLYSDALKHPAVVAFVARAAADLAALQMAAEVNATLNRYRRNEGKDHLSTHIFALLEMDLERHCPTKTLLRRLESLQKRAGKSLGVPTRDVSLPWKLIAQQER